MQTNEAKTKDGKSNVTLTKLTRSTKYIVGVHFSTTGKENISDKILRLIKNDIANDRQRE